MKRLISVSVYDFSIPFASRYYITKYYNFNLECTIMSRDLGLIRDRYLLQLVGSEENIQMFIDYLKHEGFKIK